VVEVISPTPFLIQIIMDLFTYVASSNPYQAKAILHKYGYSIVDVKNENDLGVCLKKLVAYEGEKALNDILDSHPDKGVILEKFCTDKKSESKNCDGGSCNCQSCRMKELQYMNFSGNQEGNNNRSIKEVGIFVISAALLLAAAIIVKK
jgi:hypothetical protein